jgi:hypothetical protein
MSSQLPAGYAPPSGVRVAGPQRPAWLIPVAIGGGLALVVIVSRRGQSAPSAVSVQPDNAAGSVADGADTAVNKALESFSATLSAQQQSESDMIAGLGASFGNMLTSDAATRAAQNTAQNGALAQMLALMQRMFGATGGNQTGSPAPVSTPSPATAPGVSATPAWWTWGATYNILSDLFHPYDARNDWRVYNWGSDVARLLGFAHLGDVQAKDETLYRKIRAYAIGGLKWAAINAGKDPSTLGFGDLSAVTPNSLNQSEVAALIRGGASPGGGVANPSAPVSGNPAPTTGTTPSGRQYETLPGGYVLPVYTAPTPIAAVAPVVDTSYPGGWILGRWYYPGESMFGTKNRYGLGFGTAQQ